MRNVMISSDDKQFTPENKKMDEADYIQPTGEQKYYENN